MRRKSVQTGETWGFVWNCTKSSEVQGNITYHLTRARIWVRNFPLLLWAQTPDRHHWGHACSRHWHGTDTLCQGSGWSPGNLCSETTTTAAAHESTLWADLKLGHEKAQKDNPSPKFKIWLGKKQNGTSQACIRETDGIRCLGLGNVKYLWIFFFLFWLNKSKILQSDKTKP